MTSVMRMIKRIIVKQWSNNSDVFSLFVLFVIAWASGYALLGEEYVGVDSVVFRLGILLICAKIGGWFVGLLAVPPLVGMLIMGVLFRNLHFIDDVEVYSTFTPVLRQLAMITIVIPAGLGLDMDELRRKPELIVNLAVIPVVLEIAIVAILTHFTIGLPWIWGFLTRFTLAAVAPLVIMSDQLKLRDFGYGVDKKIHEIIAAASTLNAFLCIAFIGIFNGVIFNDGLTNSLNQILFGPIMVIMSLTYGVILALMCRHVPHKNEAYLVTLRTLLLGLGCLLAAFGSNTIDYGGAGPLSCIIASCVVNFLWWKQGWTTNNPVRANFVLLWKFLEPVSFAFIGLEVDCSILHQTVILWSLLILSFPLTLRMMASYGITQCTNFNTKEQIFVALCWIPKATVQGTIGPVTLVLARNSNATVLEGYANNIIIIAVVSILITSPISSALVKYLGPKLLKVGTSEVVVE